MAEFGTDEWMAEARVEIKKKACPACGELLDDLEWRYVATDGSLAGMQDKVSVARMLIATSSSCPHLVHLYEE